MDKIPWHYVVVAAALWFVGSSLIGIGAAVVSGQHGSVVFGILGITIGICGALTNAALLFFSRFRHMPSFHRSALVCFASMTLFAVVMGVVFSWPLKELMATTLSLAGPVAVVACVINVSISRKTSA